MRVVVDLVTLGGRVAKELVQVQAGDTIFQYRHRSQSRSIERHCRAMNSIKENWVTDLGRQRINRRIPRDVPNRSGILESTPE
jgi:hypothetical protein